MCERVQIYHTTKMEYYMPITNLFNYKFHLAKLYTALFNQCQHTSSYLSVQLITIPPPDALTITPLR